MKRWRNPPIPPPTGSSLFQNTLYCTVNTHFLECKEDKAVSKSVQGTAELLGTRIVLRMCVLDEQLEKRMHRKEERENETSVSVERWSAKENRPGSMGRPSEVSLNQGLRQTGKTD